MSNKNNYVLGRTKKSQRERERGQGRLKERFLQKKSLTFTIIEGCAGIFFLTGTSFSLYKSGCFCKYFANCGILDEVSNHSCSVSVFQRQHQIEGSRGSILSSSRNLGKNSFCQKALNSYSHVDLSQRGRKIENRELML